MKSPRVTAVSIVARIHHHTWARILRIWSSDLEIVEGLGLASGGYVLVRWVLWRTSEVADYAADRLMFRPRRTHNNTTNTEAGACTLSYQPQSVARQSSEHPESFTVPRVNTHKTSLLGVPEPGFAGTRIFRIPRSPSRASFVTIKAFVGISQRTLLSFN